MTRSKHDAHFTALHVAQEARKVGWGDNLAPDTGIVQPEERKDAAVAPQMNSEPGNPERDKRAMYRPAHRSASGDSAPVNLDQSMSGRPKAGPIQHTQGIIASGFPGNGSCKSGAGVAPGPLSPSKYGNVRTAGYASRREAKRAAVLRLLQDTKVISGLREQVEFVLIPRQLDEHGKVAERACVYVCDFQYTDVATGKQITEDCKGHKTEVYRLKRKLLLFVHGIRILET